MTVDFVLGALCAALVVAMWAVTGVAFMVFITYILVKIARASGPPQRWTRAAREKGLKVDTTGWGPKLRGLINGFGVSVRHVLKDKVVFTQVTLTGLPRRIELRSEGVLDAIGKLLGSEDLQLGAPVFDRAARLGGTEELLRATLDHKTRDLLRGVLGGLNVSGGRMMYEERGRDLDVSRVLDSLIAIATRIREASEDTAAHLEQVARTDPMPLVRAGALGTLTRIAPDEAAVVAREALHQDHPQLVLAAAKVLRDGPRLLWALEQPQLPEQERLALLAWIAENAAEHVEDAVAIGLYASSLPLQRAALRHLRSAELHTLRGRPAQEVLLQVLDTQRDDLRIEAIRALGAVGDVGAVEPMLRFRRPGLLEDAESMAASQAIAQIQSRLDGAQAGALSVAKDGGGSGALSEAKRGTGGELSAAAAAARRERS